MNTLYTLAALSSMFFAPHVFFRLTKNFCMDSLDSPFYVLSYIFFIIISGMTLTAPIMYVIMRSIDSGEED